ncbi:MAG: response regulator transcription factor [Anaerolineae bacterium]|nr:response regulator transcription factor [Anaerolineae bacterium]
MNKSILIVENDLKEREIWKTHLQRQGYSVTTAPLGTDLVRTGVADDAALILLGIPAFNVNIDEITRWIGQWCHIPIIALGRTDDPSMVVQLLDAGADDFVTRPCRRDELLARVRAALRRQAQAGQTSAYVVNIDGFTLDFNAKRAFVDNRDIKLTRTEFSLLAELARRTGHICTHDELLGKVWGGECWDANHYLHVYFGRIRKKLGAKYSALLETIAGMGYVLHVSLADAFPR